MSETPTGAPEPTPAASSAAPAPASATAAPAVRPADAAWARKARGALQRYRVMAWITGTMLLLLTVVVLLKYVFHAPGWDTEGDWRNDLGKYIAMAHGWIYVVYLFTVAHLWATMRWRLGRLTTLAAAGVVPVMSFILERKAHAQALARIEAAER
ncbi:DUF3817 domain-containing protein [Cellulomonas sp. JH27-2]|uniref:DUF3817 domain-containing protein n=1 Tax=Cellulomonas sp. JH27-2 TaxID=2774139 RepID=UPI00177D4B91|nr:DUF3817 domain-containing protein [Cellulomonas sp. JH27-2]